jgi:hypothetical protein
VIVVGLRLVRGLPPRRGLRRALEAIVARHLTMARIAEGLSVAPNTASDAVPCRGQAGPDRCR